MKKYYSSPKMEVTDVEVKQLLAGSYLDNGTDEEAGARLRCKRYNKSNDFERNEDLDIDFDED